MDIITIIFLPFLVGILTNRFDAIVVAPIIENVFKRLNQGDKAEFLPAIQEPTLEELYDQL